MRVLDTTLREGCQRWGVYFPFKVKKGIAKRLIELGVEEIEIGVVGEEKLKDLSFLKLLLSLKRDIPMRRLIIFLKMHHLQKKIKIFFPFLFCYQN